MIEEKPPVAVVELDALCEEIFKQREKIELMDKEVSKENTLLAALEQKAATYLEELGRDSFKSPYGTIGVSEIWRFNLPQTDEDKFKFFDYLREKGLFDKYATVNANSYNSFLNAEWEAAKARGEGFDFQVPGVPEPKLFKKLTKRKA